MQYFCKLLFFDGRYLSIALNFYGLHNIYIILPDHSGLGFCVKYYWQGYLAAIGANISIVHIW